MSADPGPSNASVTLRAAGDVLEVALAGTWQVTEPRPAWAEVLGGQTPARVRPLVAEVGKWDSSLLLFLFEVQQWCRGSGAYCETDGLPEKIRTLLTQLAASHETSVPFDRSENFITTVGLAAQDVLGKVRAIFQFVGECTLSAIGLIKRPGRFRWRDCILEMQQCGAMAVPIVSLSSFLVGLTLAYTGAIILRQFGGDIWVADIVGLSTLREMGAVMTGVVLAGRTGAAFAAQLGNMKANEEIDALETLGIAPVDFLVLPRLVALTLMTPLLAMYANCLGIFGGMVVSATVLEIPPNAYWIETQSNIDLADVSVSLIKSVIFGMLIAVASCLRGLQAERSAAGVGRAATSAVVTSILLLIVADAVFAVLFNVLGL